MPVKRYQYASLLFATFVAALPAMRAHAEEASDTVRSLEIELGRGPQHATLSLSFDEAIPRSEAESIRSALEEQAHESATSAAAEEEYSLQSNGSPIACNDTVALDDTNGRFAISYLCGVKRRLIWAFQIKAAIRAIIVPPVVERGLSWFVHGEFRGQNAPHTVPADYLFHGTMSNVVPGDVVDYSDYYTFRHNLGGTGTLAIAGTVNLVN